MKKKRALLVVCMVIAVFIGCKRWSLRTDQKAIDAVQSMKKLLAMTETGATLRDYTAALGDANFAVKQFLESDKANAKPEFSNSLRNAIKWYKAGQGVWDRSSIVPLVIGYCETGELPSFTVDELCRTYPELVTTVPGKNIFTAGNSRGFAIYFVNYTMSRDAIDIYDGKKDVGSPWIIYKFAINESWKRANFEVDNAKLILNEMKPNSATPSSFKSTKSTELDYFTKETSKWLESQR